MRFHKVAVIATVLIASGSTGAIAGRGGFRGGSASGFHVGGASSSGTSHSYGGYGGTSGAGKNPYGGSSSAGYRGGSYDTARGGTVNYGAAGRTATGPGGASAGRGVYGVSGTTAGGRSYGQVGQVGGAKGPGGAAVGGRSSFGAASGPNGMVAGGSRGGFATTGSGGHGGAVWHGGGYGGYNSGWMHGNWGGGYGGWGYGAAGLGIGLAGWGLGSALYSNGWGYMPYANPYYAVPAANFPQAAGTYDYSQPIDTTSPAAPEAVAQPAMTAFDQARAAFTAKDYANALALVDQAIKGTPNNEAAHEFRGVTLFALGRYDDAAGALYGVLSVGPGWDWTTLITLYPDIETYTTQLRALEQSVRLKPGSAPTRFVLAYLYLTAGQNDAAIGEFKQIVSLQPTDTVSAQLLQSLTKGQPGGAGTPPAPAQVQTVPSGKIAGTWTASPAQGSTITLKVASDGKFTWTILTKGQPHVLSGQSTLGNDDLTLVQDEGGPPMVGHLTWKDANDFAFVALGGGPGDPGLAFRRSP